MNRKILKITTLSALAAIGVVLMSYIKIPYPVAPFLQIEISDFVVIYAFLLFGFKEALIVALLKTGCDMLVNGFQTTGGGIPFVAHGIALFASLVYILAFWIANKIIKSKKLVFSGLKYTIVILIVSTIMTLANYIILTPLYLGEVSFFGIGISEGTANALTGLTGTDVYFLANVILYFPFNLLKSSIISITALAIGDTLLALFKNRFHFNSDKKNNNGNEQETQNPTETEMPTE